MLDSLPRIGSERSPGRHQWRMEGVLVSTISKLAAKREINKLTSHRKKLNPIAYAVAGLGCFTAAAFTYQLWAGLVVTGISFFIIEWRVGE